MLADKVVMRVTNLMKRDLYDIVKVDWFKRCLDAQTFIPWYEKINLLNFLIQSCKSIFFAFDAKLSIV